MVSELSLKIGAARIQEKGRTEGLLSVRGVLGSPPALEEEEEEEERKEEEQKQCRAGEGWKFFYCCLFSFGFHVRVSLCSPGWP